MSLRTATFSATRWTAASAIIRAVLQMLQTAILARLLAPADFGLMAMAGAAIAIASLFSDLGLSNALMHFSQPDRRTLSTLYWLNLLMAATLALVFTALAWPISQVYSQNELLPILLWLSLCFPLSALGHQFRILAEKNMQFRPLVQNEVVAAVMGFISAIVVANAGKGIYALLTAILVSTTINSTLAWIRLSSGITPLAHFRPLQVKPFIMFGLHTMGDRFWNTLRMQADIFIAGIYITPTALAAYSVPRDQNLKIANSIINPVIIRVGLPVMAQLKNDITALRSAYLKTLRLTASFNFPAYTIVAIFADEIVALLLGNQWQEAGFYMRLFALWGLIRSTGNPSGSLLYAVGMARRAHIWNILQFFISVPMIWFAVSNGDLSRLAWTMLVWQLAIFLLAWRFLIFPACGVNLIEYCASISLPLSATAIASSLTLFTIDLLPEKQQLLIGLFVFSGAYVVLSWHMNRDWLFALLELATPLKRFLK